MNVETIAGRATALRIPDLMGNLPRLSAGVAFLVLFWTPMEMLAYDWWNNPEAGHGLLLAPLSIYLAWKSGLVADRVPRPVLGSAILLSGILLRYASALAAERFTMRFSMLLALAGLIIFWYGVRQVLHWWLPGMLLFLSIPLPEVVLASLALPLQMQASQIGAALLEWRQIPVLLAGNVIHLPGRSLFVTEACSGLRSLTALIALGVLIGGLWLRYPLTRIALLAVAIPVAVLLNGIRVFLTGFLVFFVDPALGEGFMHMTEGWIIFVVAFAILGAVAWVIARGEDVFRRRFA